MLHLVLRLPGGTRAAQTRKPMQALKYVEVMEVPEQPTRLALLDYLSLHYFELKYVSIRQGADIVKGRIRDLLPYYAQVYVAREGLVKPGKLSRASGDLQAGRDGQFPLRPLSNIYRALWLALKELSMEEADQALRARRVIVMNGKGEGEVTMHIGVEMLLADGAIEGLPTGLQGGAFQQSIRPRFLLTFSPSNRPASRRQSIRPVQERRLRVFSAISCRGTSTSRVRDVDSATRLERADPFPRALPRAGPPSRRGAGGTGQCV